MDGASPHGADTWLRVHAAVLGHHAGGASLSCIDGWLQTLRRVDPAACASLPPETCGDCLAALACAWAPILRKNSDGGPLPAQQAALLRAYASLVVVYEGSERVVWSKTSLRSVVSAVMPVLLRDNGTRSRKKKPTDVAVMVDCCRLLSYVLYEQCTLLSNSLCERLVGAITPFLSLCDDVADPPTWRIQLQRMATNVVASVCASPGPGVSKVAHTLVDALTPALMHAVRLIQTPVEPASRLQAVKHRTSLAALRLVGSTLRALHCCLARVRHVPTASLHKLVTTVASLAYWGTPLHEVRGAVAGHASEPNDVYQEEDAHDASAIKASRDAPRAAEHDSDDNSSSVSSSGDVSSSSSAWPEELDSSRSASGAHARGWRVRLHALLCLAAVHEKDSKKFSPYWPLLLPSSGDGEGPPGSGKGWSWFGVEGRATVLALIHNDASPKVRKAALTLVTNMLQHGKGYLAMALLPRSRTKRQASASRTQVTSFIPLSQTIAQLVHDLHVHLAHAAHTSCATLDAERLVPRVYAAASMLAQNTPYVRVSVANACAPGLRALIHAAAWGTHHDVEVVRRGAWRCLAACLGPAPGLHDWLWSRKEVTSGGGTQARGGGTDGGSGDDSDGDDSGVPDTQVAGSSVQVPHVATVAQRTPVSSLNQPPGKVLPHLLSSLHACVRKSLHTEAVTICAPLIPIFRWHVSVVSRPAWQSFARLLQSGALERAKAPSLACALLEATEHLIHSLDAASAAQNCLDPRLGSVWSVLLVGPQAPLLRAGSVGSLQVTARVVNVLALLPTPGSCSTLSAEDYTPCMVLVQGVAVDGGCVPGGQQDDDGSDDDSKGTTSVGDAVSEVDGVRAAAYRCLGVWAERWGRVLFDVERAAFLGCTVSLLHAVCCPGPGQGTVALVIASRSAWALANVTHSMAEAAEDDTVPALSLVSNGKHDADADEVPPMFAQLWECATSIVAGAVTHAKAGEGVSATWANGARALGNAVCLAHRLCPEPWLASHAIAAAQLLADSIVACCPKKATLSMAKVTWNACYAAAKLFPLTTVLASESGRRGLRLLTRAVAQHAFAGARNFKVRQAATVALLALQDTEVWGGGLWQELLPVLSLATAEMVSHPSPQQRKHAPQLHEDAWKLLCHVLRQCLHQASGETLIATVPRSCWPMLLLAHTTEVEAGEASDHSALLPPTIAKLMQATAL